MEKHYIDAFLPLESEFDMQNFHKYGLVMEKAILVEKMLIFRIKVSERRHIPSSYEISKRGSDRGLIEAQHSKIPVSSSGI